MLAQSFLSEFEAEAATTRRFLERVPESKLMWKPHEKSMTTGQLALHIAQLTAGIATMAQQDFFVAPDFSKPNAQPATVKEILDAHDASVKVVQDLLPKMSDEFMGKTWAATVEGKPILSMPRAGVIRVLLLNHLIQHRGQLSIYLRMLGAKVPFSYGPSADESPFG